jgi:hypothetical protein
MSESAIVQGPSDESLCEEGRWGEIPNSYDGVEGVYQRQGSVPQGAMKTLELRALTAVQGVTRRADSVRSFECAAGSSCPEETAKASLTAANAAINPILLISANGFDTPMPDIRDGFNVLGIKRTPDGNVAGLCLWRFEDPATAPVNKGFLMLRE